MYIAPATPVRLPAGLAVTDGGAGWPYATSKRALDVAVALLLLLCLAPVMLLCALAILLETGRPVLFRQVRVGEHGRRFTMIKFRSMRAGTDPAPHRAYITALIAGQAPAQPSGDRPAPPAGQRRPVFKLVGDTRVTAVGRWIRRTSIDELPQLWNVLRGDMSVVGPRPPIPYEVEQYKPAHMARLEAKPGITGLWQVEGRGRTTFDEMVGLDVEYIRRRSLWLDLEIMLRTVPAVLLRRGAH